MNITIKDNKLTVGEFSTRVSNVLSVIVDDYNNITFTLKGGAVKTVAIADAKVNGIQMTVENMDQLLAPIFEFQGCCTCCSSGSSTTTELCPYSKVDYTKPLVFPTPIRTGHIVDFIKDGEVYRSYQWDGQAWQVLSGKANLVYKIVEYYGSIDYTTDPAIISAEKIDGKYYLAILDDTTLSSPITTDKLEVVDNSYRMAGLTMCMTENQSEYHFEDLKIDNLRAEVLNSNGDTFPYAVYVKNVEGVSVSSNYVDLVHVEGLKGNNSSIASSVNVFANNMTIKDSKLSGIFSMTCLDSTKTLPPTINIINNDFTLAPSGFIIISSGIMADNNISTSRSINISNNKGVSSISIDFGYCGIVDSAIFDFDEISLDSISIMSSILSEASLEALVVALTSKTYTKANRTFNFMGLSEKGTLYPSEEQKARLTNAGWNLSIY